MQENPFADLIPGSKVGPRGPTAVQNRRLEMGATGESIESANVNQAQGRTALAVDTAVVPSDIAKRRADSTKSQLDALEASVRSRVPGGLATQDERQTAFNYLRMLGSKASRDFAVAKDKKAGEAPLLPELVERLPLGDIASNYMVSPERQRVVANNLDMLDAALWLSTGAAYNKEQLRNISRSYFAQPGDKPETIADKDARLNNLIVNARVRASMGLMTPGGQAALGEATGGQMRDVTPRGAPKPTVLRKPSAGELAQYQKIPPANRRAARQKLEAAGVDISGLR